METPGTKAVCVDRTSQYQSPEAEAGLACSRSSKEAGVAGAQCAGDKDREGAEGAMPDGKGTCRLL